MTVYERIKNRRKKLGLTADDVADALGVSRATVYRYESAYIEKLPITSLEPLSKVLHCTPAYLMGWEDEPSTIMQKSNFSLSNLEKEIIIAYRKLDQGQKDMVCNMLGISHNFQAQEENIS